MEDLILIGDKYKLTILKEDIDTLIRVLYEMSIDNKINVKLENNK